MNRFSTLQFRLSALLFAFGCVLIAISYTRQIRRDLVAQSEQMQVVAYSEGTRLSGLAQHFFRRHLDQSADLAISYASAHPDLKLGVMCDGDDVIRYATDKQWRGVKVDVSPLKMALPLARRARESMEGLIERTGSRGDLVAVFPFWDAAGSLSKGMVILDYDMDGPLATARSRALVESAAQGCALLGGCMLLWALLRVLVTSRVARIVEQTRHIGWDTRIPAAISGHDDLSQISAGIVDAVTQLQGSERRFSQLASKMRDVFWVAPATPAASPYVNPAYERIFGQRPTEIQGHRWRWLRRIVKEDRRKALEMLRGLRTSVGERDLEVRVRGDGQDAKWVLCRGFSTPGDLDEAAPFQVAGIAMDITERKEIEKLMIEAAEQERKRIGHDLHDDVCQRLAAAQLKSGVLQASLKREFNPQANIAGDVARELAEATDLARAYARGLAPVAAAAESMSDALAELRDFLQRIFSLKCEVICDDVDGLLPPDDAAQVYRIAQELSVNAAKHAAASWIKISLSAGKMSLRLEVRNDGAPFNPGKLPKRNGMGLHMVRQRVDALGAALSFQTLEGKNGATLAVCEIPVKLIKQH